jgi:hypothetical protein
MLPFMLARTSYDTLVTETRKTSLLPNIRDDASSALFGFTQGFVSYASYTQLFNDFSPEVSTASYGHLTVLSLHYGMANFQLHTQACLKLVSSISAEGLQHALSRVT